MDAVIEAIPQTGDIRLTIEVAAKQNFSAKSAQKIVGRFAADEISYLDVSIRLSAGEFDLAWLNADNACAVITVLGSK